MVIHGGEATKSGLDQYSIAGASSNSHPTQSGIHHEGKHSKRRENGPLSGVCPHDGLYLAGAQNNPLKVKLNDNIINFNCTLSENSPQPC